MRNDDNGALIMSVEELKEMLDKSKDYQETMTFMCESTGAGMNMHTITDEGLNLDQVAEAFVSFLRGAGFTYVDGVEIHTQGGNTFGSEL